MAINQKTDLTHLYEFRVSNGQEFLPFPSRYAASKKIASWIMQGQDKADMTAERKVDGQWQEDTATFEQADKHFERAANRSIANRKRTDPVRQALKNLSGATRLANMTKELTREHLQAVYDACQDFIAASDGEE